MGKSRNLAKLVMPNVFEGKINKKKKYKNEYILQIILITITILNYFYLTFIESHKIVFYLHLHVFVKHICEIIGNIVY